VNNFTELVLKNRSYRRFYENQQITKEILLDLIDLARQTPSAANKQPLKYYVSNTKEINKKIFNTLKFAGYLKNWSGPIAGERPSAYIVILRDLLIPHPCEIDHGIAAQTIMLGAVEKGYGGCMVAAINKKELMEIINPPPNIEILLVLAIGKPKEKVILEDIGEGDCKYYRDDSQTHHVPKRKLNNIVLNFK